MENSAIKSRESGKNRIVFYSVAICLSLVVIGVAGFFAFRMICGSNIPELQAIDRFTEGSYELYFYEYDGKVMASYDIPDNYIPLEGADRDERIAHIKTTYERLNKTIHRLSSFRGRKTTEWTPEDITYPIYAFTVKSSNIDSVNHHGESFVWSNGYLITNSGDVYICDADLAGIVDDLDEDYYKREFEWEGTYYGSWSRPLLYANSGWRAEELHEMPDWSEYKEYGLEAKVIDQYEEDGWPLVTIEIRNNSDKDWNYEDFQPFFGIGILIDGEAYYVLAVDGHSTYNAVISYDSVLAPGESMIIEYCPDEYFPLVPGEYIIMIYGKVDEETCNVSAVYPVG